MVATKRSEYDRVMKRAAVWLVFVVGCGSDGEDREGLLWTIALIVGLVAVGLVLEFLLSDSERMRRAFRRARRVSIAEAPEGEVVRIYGRVLPGETVEAPLTGRRCVYYSVNIGVEVPYVLETGGVAFTIDDGTGRAIVDPNGARIIESDRAEWRFIDKPTAREAAFLARHGIEPPADNDTFGYKERVFEIGGPIAVMCRPVRLLAPDAAAADSRSAVYRDEPPVHLRVGGSSTLPIRRIRPGKNALTDAPILLGDAEK